ncbi:MAG: hypothetical protein NTW49_06685 [Bacteroidia bacterium]|nr:hypothetical protein [Bacteroidia bacterium]
MKLFIHYLRKYHIIFISLAMVMTAVVSCRKDLPDHLFDQWKPQLAAPIARMSLTLKNVINSKDTNIVIGSDGFIRFVYRRDSIYYYNMSQIYTIPVQQATHEKFLLGELSINDFGPLSTTAHLSDMILKIDPVTASTIQALNGLTAPLPSMSSDQTDTFSLSQADNFQNITLSSGNIIIKATNNLPVTFDSITLTPQSYYLSNLVTLSSCHFYNFSPGQTQTQTIPLSNTTLYNQFRVIMEQFHTQASNGSVLINLSDGILITVTTSNLRVTHGLAKLPEQIFTSQTQNIIFNSGGDERITHAHFANASLSYTIASSIGTEIHGDLVLTTVTSNGSTAQKTFDIPSNSQTNDTWSLPNSDFDFSTVPSQPYNLLPVNYQVWINATNQFIQFDSNDSIAFNVTLNTLQITMIQGYFGQKTINISTDTIDTKFQYLSNISGSVYLTNPKLDIIITNSIGVPSNLIFDLKNHSTNGSTYSLNLDPIAIPYPAAPGQIINQYYYQVTNANANLSDFLSHIPNIVDFQGNINVNPAGFVDYSNFVSNTGYVKMGIEFDLPLQLRATNLTFCDTVAFKLNQDDYQKVDRAQLFINVQNGFPFDISLNLTVLDSVTHITYDHFDNIITTSALVNSDGRVTKPVSSVAIYDLDRSRINNILLSNKLIFTVIMNTINHGTQDVKIYTDYNIKVKLAAKVTGNLTGDDIHN